jgi:hypothetical protein
MAEYQGECSSVPAPHKRMVPTNGTACQSDPPDTGTDPA